MSYDGGRRGRIDDENDRASDETVPTGPLRAVVARLRRHVREWPSRYVEQQARVYER
ncbi:hypothetical protein [Halobacterium sp. CBA1126]|uniref:hypothetical protein n=1 Tax=Halobacterium TaxID=2239 RepID=UPI0012FB9601|nr:hypothetical protein [Halobacterium sp. CBA1126]MUV61590.1 hypothetical protein [Halobacterium sp. CBA1126]